MGFFTTAITTLKTLVCAIGVGLAAWGGINLLEGFGNDNPGANAHDRLSNIKLYKTARPLFRKLVYQVLQNI